MPSKKHFHEALRSDCLDQFTEHAEGERQGKHYKHDCQSDRLLYRQERLTVCFGESDVLVASKRDNPVNVMEDHRGEMVKAGIPHRAINKRASGLFPGIKKGMEEQDS